MKFLSIPTAVVLSISFVNAIPNAPAPRTSREKVGAAYFINNEPAGNFLVVHDILSDGTVSFAKGVPAGGVGRHGIGEPVPTPTGTDQLFSQGSVAISGDYLFAVNPGSNTLSMFSINPDSPTDLTPIGKPISSQGDQPQSIGASPTTSNVCVLNSGQNNGVACFKADPKKGLSLLKDTTRAIGINATTPPSGPFNSTTQAQFSLDGKSLIVPVKGDFTTPGFLAHWDVMPDGSLSSTYTKSVVNGTALPFSITPIVGTEGAYLNTDPGENGYTIWNFANGPVATGQVFTIENSTTICWSARNPKTGTYFIVDSGAATISELTIDTKTLQPTLLNSLVLANNSGTIDTDIALINGKSYLYTLASAFTSIDVLDINTPGHAALIQAYNFTEATQKAKVTAPRGSQGMVTYIKKQFRTPAKDDVDGSDEQ